MRGGNNASQDSLRDDILASVPKSACIRDLAQRAMAIARMTVQETLLRALANIDSFQPGSNLPSWLFTICATCFRSDYRKRRREVEDAEAATPRR